MLLQISSLGNRFLASLCGFDIAGFIADAHNLILVGGTDTGKTHLTAALGFAAIHQGKRIRFFNAVDLVNRLEQKKQQDKTGNLARKHIQVDAVILYELGYLPFPESGGRCYFISSANYMNGLR